jgi:hypothetical protein
LHKHPPDPLLRQRSESLVEIARIAYRFDDELLPLRLCVRPSFADVCFRIDVLGIGQQAEQLTLGRSSRSRLNRFATTAVVSKPLMPVKLPPGRRRLVAKPSRTGSPLVLKTIGIVFVAAFAAKAAGSPPEVTITETPCRTKT